MAYEIRPLGLPSAPDEQPRFSSPSWGWLSRQPFSRDAAWSQIGNFAPGRFQGGPTESQWRLLEDPMQARLAAKAPPLITESALKRNKMFTRTGAISLDIIDPFVTGQNIAEGFGASEQQATDLVGQLAAGLESKDIDPFGLGSRGVPARLLDYAAYALSYLSPAGEFVRQQWDREAQGRVPGELGAFKYPFQRDQGYWYMLRQDTSTDEHLLAVATEVAGRYASGDDTYLRDKLFEQFKLDRDVALGVSSGDRKIDYLAKLAFQRDYIAERTGGVSAAEREQLKTQPGGYVEFLRRQSGDAELAAAMQLPAAIASAIPFAGIEITERAYQPPKQVEDAWGRLTQQERLAYFGEAGGTALAGDLVFWLPVLTGAGAVEAVASSSGGIPLAAYKTWTATRNITTGLMATGFAVGMANWAAEAAIPGYSESLGQKVDYARPISSSSLAYLANQIGFFSSGTFGAWTTARVAARVPGAVGAVARKVLPGLPEAGSRELQAFKQPTGGSVVQRELARTGIGDPGILDLAPRAVFQNRLLNWMERERRSMAEAAMRGQPTGRAIDQIVDSGEKLAAVNGILRNALGQVTLQAEGIMRAMTEARRPRPLFAGEAQRAHDVAVKVARWVDHEMAADWVTFEGPAFMAQQAGAYTKEALEAYAKAYLRRLGGDPAKLARHDLEGWAQVIRAMRAYEFTKNAGILETARDGSREAGRVIMMRTDHVFANDSARYLATLRGDDAAAAQGLAASLVRDKLEAAEWYAKEWKPPAGTPKRPETASPTALADWLEEVTPALPSRRILPDPASPHANEPLNTFHAELEGQGQWTLAFRPVDDAGEAISYVVRPSGQVFKSPWLEYPATAPAAIEMGNRSLLLSRADGITRGFRSRQILEWQKGMLFRRLTGRFTDVTPGQVEQFQAGVLRLAREYHAQPQTIGAVARARAPLFGAPTIRKNIEELADEVFGKGKMRLRDGTEVLMTGSDWGDEIAKSFIQSYKLNLTAGLTSHLKANLGELGTQLAWYSDVAYLTWRFNLSPFFKLGEFWESGQFGAMRGVRGIDAMTEALYLKAGIGNDFTLFESEQLLDDIVRATGGARTPGVEVAAIPNTASARNAAALSFYARNLPEDFTLAAQTQSLQRTAADWRASHGHGGSLPDADWLPTRRPGRVLGVDDELPEGFSRNLSDHAPEFVDPDLEEQLMHATTSMEGVYRDGLKAGRDVPNVGLGTGGTGMHQVSVTWDGALADTIAARLRLVGRASKGEATVDEILDHFAEGYGEDVWAMADALGIYDAAYHPNMTWDELNAAIKNEKAWKRGEFIDLTTPEGKFEAIVRLDNKMWPGDAEHGFRGWVGLNLEFEDALRINPDDVGVVQVAARKNSAGVRSGPDYAEIRFDPEDVLVIDDRPALPPLADDADGLLRQLRETLATEPKQGQMSVIDHLVGGNGIAPGLEQRARRILTKLEDLQAQSLDGGPTFAWDTLLPRQQEEFIARLKTDGWEPVTEFWALSRSEQIRVAKELEAQGYVLHGSSVHPETSTQINNLAGFFTTTSFEDAAWYGSRIAGGRAMRGRPPGTVYVARRPNPDRVLDLTAPHGTDQLLSQIQKDTADLTAWMQKASKRGEAWRKALAYQRRVNEFVEGWGPKATKDAAAFRLRLNRFDSALYEVAVARGQWLREAGIKPDLPVFDASYLNDLLESLDLEAIKVLEPAMVKRETPEWLLAKKRLTAAERKFKKAIADGNQDVINRAKSAEAVARAELNDLESSLTNEIPVWIFRRRPPVQPIEEIYPKLADTPYASRIRLDDTPEVRPVSELFDEYQRRPGSAESMEQVAGTAEALFENTLPAEAERALADPAVTGWKRRAWQSVKDAYGKAAQPAPWKVQQATKLQIKLFRDEFPALLELSGNQGVIKVLSDLRIPRNRWSDWLIEDRTLLGKWLDEPTKANFDALLAHAGDDAASRAVFNDLYASGEWASLSTLMHAHLKALGEEAFGVHFFAPYRSWLERSINHPLLGVYPASWTIKTAREWAKFLFDNRMLGIEIGMAPAQAIAQLANDQVAAIAQAGMDFEDSPLGIRGPLGSPIFIFNLLMPGDWSGLPFSASRTIRDYARPLLSQGELPDTAEVVRRNLFDYGTTRDLRLMGESLGQFGDIFRELAGWSELPPEQVFRGYSYRGRDTQDPSLQISPVRG